MPEQPGGAQPPAPRTFPPCPAQGGDGAGLEDSLGCVPSPAGRLGGRHASRRAAQQAPQPAAQHGGPPVQHAAQLPALWPPPRRPRRRGRRSHAAGGAGAAGAAAGGAAPAAPVAGPPSAAPAVPGLAARAAGRGAGARGLPPSPLQGLPPARRGPSIRGASRPRPGLPGAGNHHRRWGAGRPCLPLAPGRLRLLKASSPTLQGALPTAAPAAVHAVLTPCPCLAASAGVPVEDFDEPRTSGSRLSGSALRLSSSAAQTSSLLSPFSAFAQARAGL